MFIMIIYEFFRSYFLMFIMIILPQPPGEAIYLLYVHLRPQSPKIIFDFGFLVFIKESCNYVTALSEISNQRKWND